ncbi:hypothetical protein BDN67DRAFT_237813 [Paxillus ammoniavirescens]|nr:hypothetical protein BDN67DRAFT_237813 [Paxillus ammoniavirescens]
MPDAPTFQSRASSSSLSPVPEVQLMSPVIPAPTVKKSKRAETRPCPACSELIPVRLLAAHAELELQRVEDIIRHVGDAEALAEVDELEEGPSSKRRSALKARQSLTALQPIPRIRSSTSSPILALSANHTTTPATIEHTISYIARRRKARHTRLKELAKEEATWLAGLCGGGRAEGGEGGGVTCPLCSQLVRGDRDVVDAHVDTCLAYESRRAQVERERERTIGLLRGNEDVDVDVNVDVAWGGDAEEGEGSVRTRVITNASLRGTGIHIRPSMLDTEDDIDIDGMDDAIFGDAQFGEADVLRVGSPSRTKVELGAHEVDVNMGVDAVSDNKNLDGDIEERSNHDRETLPDLVGEGKQKAASQSRSQSQSLGSQSQPEDATYLDADTDKLDLAILAARSRGDQLALIIALEAKLNAVPAPPTCRICLSPYVDPTVSTGCWHTCCSTCWLRCLGATKLCPMCQRITGAGELRRVYL